VTYEGWPVVRLYEQKTLTELLNRENYVLHILSANRPLVLYGGVRPRNGRLSRGFADATTTRNATENATTGPTESTTLDRTTVPDAAISDDDAKERALAAEKEYLTEQLQSAPCLNNWGTYPTTARKRATVAGRTSEGVRIEVFHPYSYSTDRVEADGASRADYLVTADEAQRIDGDAVSPC
jgi:hypothetical protein